MNNLQQKIAVIISRWPWEEGKVPQGWDIAGQLQRQGGAVPLPAIIAALEALAKTKAIRIAPTTPPGNMMILEVYSDRLDELVP